MDAPEMDSRMQSMEVMRDKLGCKVDVSEVFSPPMIAAMAHEVGLRRGFSLDLTCKRADGSGWNFDSRRHQTEALQLINELRPMLVIGSPPCTVWSNLQKLNKHVPGYAEKLEKGKQRSRRHLTFCVKIYRAQMEQGRYFLHEHLFGAGSWRKDNMEKLKSDSRVQGQD